MTLTIIEIKQNYSENAYTSITQIMNKTKEKKNKLKIQKTKFQQNR